MITASFLRGSALAWYCISCQRSPTAITITWAEIRAALEKQFGVIQETRNARDKLRTLVYKGSVLVYMDIFQAAAMSIKNSNKHKPLHAFIYGLKENVQAEVQLQDSKT